MLRDVQSSEERKLQIPRAFGRTAARPLIISATPAVAVPIIGEQYRDLRLDAIQGDSPLQTRAAFTLEDDDDRALVASLAGAGQRVPILVVEEPAGAATHYRILDGHRRVAALRHLDRSTVKAIVYRKESLECDLVTLTANIRKNLTPMEQARALARLRERHQLTDEAIAQSVGISRAYFYQLKTLLKSDPAIQREVEAMRLSARAARALSKAPPQKQPELAQVATRYELSEADARRLVEQVVVAEQAPREAAEVIGLTPRERESGTQVKAASARAGDARSSRSPREGLTLDQARALIVTYFPDISPRMTQSLADSALQRGASATVIKAAVMLVASGWECAEALAAAEAGIRRPDIRKALVLADLCADLDRLVAAGKVSLECAPLLAAVIRNLSTVKQAALQVGQRK
jgi:ParB/RepB/Spo0J family partition protein